jgi:chemotaxis protein methyltransferase CheR
MKIKEPLKKAEEIERELLLQAIYEAYGYDFSNYTQSSQKRRIQLILEKYNLPSISALQHEILYDSQFFSKIINDLTLVVTEFFRDPEVYVGLIKEVFPYLKTYSQIKIWHAGCATGEEVYSLAILLTEAGIYDRCQIYATDINKSALEKARKGIYELDNIKAGVKNYFLAGGSHSLNQYVHAKEGAAILDKKLSRNIVFSDHNLVTDQSFGEMQLILCRNVLIYFNRELQDSVFDIFTHSLSRGGYLCLGTKESLDFSKQTTKYETILEKEKIYRLKRGEMS